MRIKIESDGTGPGTRITDAETGEEIRGVVRVSWEILDPKEPAMVSLDILAHRCNLEGKLGQVRIIHMRNDESQQRRDQQDPE